MKRILAVLVAVIGCAGLVALPNVAGAGPETPNATGKTGIVSAASTEVITAHTFNSADDVLLFDVTVAGTHPDTQLKVSTADCCILGDEWGVSLLTDTYAPHEGTPPTGCGNGTGSFSGGRNTPIGAATTTIRVMVFYCRGVDTFPAGMSVRFIGTNNPTSVTPTLVQHYTPAP